MKYLFNGIIREKDCVAGREELSYYRGLDSDGFLAFAKHKVTSASLACKADNPVQISHVPYHDFGVIKPR